MRVRRKLFSSPRRKLFSIEPRTYRCQDCGYIMETGEETTDLVCPKCGGRRFNIEKTFSEGEKKERISLFSSAENFQCDSDLEKKLKTFSGKTLDSERFQKEFSALGITALDLKEKGFASVDESGNTRITEEAYLQSKLFSKITITVTKEFDLDPGIMDGSVSKESIIDKLENKPEICPRGIILIKKAHGIPLCPDHNSWLHDSGISHDLPMEFGGTVKPMVDFKKDISERYPDAPENLLDLLKEKGIISIDGDKVEIKNDKI